MQYNYITFTERYLVDHLLLSLLCYYFRIKLQQIQRNAANHLVPPHCSLQRIPNLQRETGKKSSCVRANGREIEIFAFLTSTY